MPRIVETTVYELEELSNEAKEKARSWYRCNGVHDEWHDAVFDDFETICRILGIELRTDPVPLMGGGVRDKPRIFFQLSFSQGDGASFEGWFGHAQGAIRGIRAHAPQDAELHRIADALQAMQRRNFYQLGATIRLRGRHCHGQSMEIAVDRDSPTGQPMTAESEDTVIQALRDLARWLYLQIRNEYEYLTSDAAVDEAISANEWTFTAQGKRFG